jgi:mono/diheme cytochrome c family protein
MTPAAANQSPKGKSKRLNAIALIVILCGAIIALSFAVNNWITNARARRLKNPVDATPASLAAGKEIYIKHCENCHGENGDGKGEKAPELSTAPTDFTDVSRMDRATDGEFYWRITKGRQPMPAFEDKLTDTERWESVDFIRTFERKISAPPTTSHGNSSTP